MICWAVLLSGYWFGCVLLTFLMLIADGYNYVVKQYWIYFFNKNRPACIYSYRTIVFFSLVSIKDVFPTYQNGRFFQVRFGSLLNFISFCFKCVIKSITECKKWFKQIFLQFSKVLMFYFHISISILSILNFLSVEILLFTLSLSGFVFNLFLHLPIM